MKNIYTQGVFDLFHIGHLNLLKKCRSIAGAGKVTVALLSDEAVTEYRGKPPIITFEDRKDILVACRYVDEVIESNIYDVQDEGADFIVVGTDWVAKDLARHYQIGRELLNEKLIYVPYTERESSTKIKERINDGV